MHHFATGLTLHHAHLTCSYRLIQKKKKIWKSGTRPEQVFELKEVERKAKKKPCFKVGISWDFMLIFFCLCVHFRQPDSFNQRDGWDCLRLSALLNLTSHDWRVRASIGLSWPPPVEHSLIQKTNLPWLCGAVHVSKDSILTLLLQSGHAVDFFFLDLAQTCLA